MYWNHINTKYQNYIVAYIIGTYIYGAITTPSDQRLIAAEQLVLFYIEVSKYLSNNFILLKQSVFRVIITINFIEN